MDHASHLETLVRDVTIIHPVTIVVLIIVTFLIILLPREKVILPFFFTILIIPMNQRIALASLDFYLPRILVIIGWIRLILRSEFYPKKMNIVDKTMIAFVLSVSISYILLWKNRDAIIFRLGYIIDTIGTYVLLRSLIRNWEDIDRIIDSFIIISILLAVLMLIEQLFHRNLLSLFGGVPYFTTLRGGKFRSQASFGHPIIAGTFGATVLCLFYYRLRKESKHFFAISGVISATIITITSSSSGPILTLMASVFALSLF